MSSNSLSPYVPLPAPHDLCLGQLERATFDHHDRFARAGHGQIEIGEFELLEGGIQNQAPSTRPTRTAAIGPFHGTLDIDSAADAAVRPSTGSFLWPKAIDEDLHFVLEASGKSGRTERSITRREVISSSEGRPSRFKSRRNLAGGEPSRGIRRSAESKEGWRCSRTP